MGINNWDLMKPRRNWRRIWECVLWTLGGALIFAILASLARGQEVPLTIKGETVTVVQKLPFTVSAPAGYHFYSWSVPVGVEFTRKATSIEITKAPKGAITVFLEASKIDFKAETVTPHFGTIKFAIGDVPPPGPIPPDPTPPNPEPVDDFEKVVLAYFVQDGRPKEKAVNLAALYRSFAGRVSGDLSLSTVGKLHAAMRDEANKFLGNLDLQQTRLAIAKELDTKLPTDPGAPLTPESRAVLSTQFTRVATALEKCK